jgi:hypothetical protein
MEEQRQDERVGEVDKPADDDIESDDLNEC